jgi:hypothetical protein
MDVIYTYYYISNTYNYRGTERGGYIWTFFSLHQRALSLEDKFSKYISKISSVVMVDACM